MFLNFPHFFFRNATNVILLTLIIFFWLFSGINSYKGRSEGQFDTNGNKYQEVLSLKSIPAESPATPSDAQKQSPSPATSSSPDPVLSSNNNQTSSASLSPENNNSSGKPDLLGEVNNFRSQNGRSGIAETLIICNFAKERLTELSTNYSHDGFSRMQSVTGKSAGAENIARTSSNRGNRYIVIEMWAKSDGHRENMLGDYTEGCGYYDGKYAVLVLAR